MSTRILWRTTVFIITLLLIYLAYPILIVPSSLPAIQQIVSKETTPDLLIQAQVNPGNFNNFPDPDLEIYQLEIPVVLSTKQKIQAIMQIHQLGLDKILNR